MDFISLFGAGAGYEIIQPGLIDPDKLSYVAELVNDALLTAGGPPTSRETSTNWVNAKRCLEQLPDLLQLLVDPLIIGLDVVPPTHCQIAWRFPGERVGEPLA